MTREPVVLVEDQERPLIWIEPRGRDWTRILLVAAIVATVGDAVAYAIFIGSGLSREMNPLWNGVSLWLALAGKAAIVVVLVAIAESRYGRAVLAVAVVVGSIGIYSTMTSI